jgi:hypothetical protein
MGQTSMIVSSLPPRQFYVSWECRKHGAIGIFEWRTFGPVWATSGDDAKEQLRANVSAEWETRGVIVDLVQGANDAENFRPSYTRTR